MLDPAELRLNSPLLGWEEDAEFSLPFCRRRQVKQEEKIELPSLFDPVKKTQPSDAETPVKSKTVVSTPRNKKPKPKPKPKSKSKPKLSQKRKSRQLSKHRSYGSHRKLKRSTARSAPMCLQRRSIELQKPACIQMATFQFPRPSPRSRKAKERSHHEQSVRQLLLLDEKVRQMSREGDNECSRRDSCRDARSGTLKLVLCRFTARAQHLSSFRSAAGVIDSFFHDVPSVISQRQKQYRRHSDRLFSTLRKYRLATCELVLAMKKFRQSFLTSPLSHDGHLLVHVIMDDTSRCP